MRKSKEIWSNEKWAVYMEGSFDGVTGFRYVDFRIKNKELDKSFKPFRVPLETVVDNKEKFKEFTRCGFKQDEVRAVVQTIRQSIDGIVYHEENDFTMTIEEIREEFIKKLEEADCETLKEWKKDIDGKVYYNIPTKTFKQWFSEGSFDEWDYRAFVRELQNKGYMLFSKGRTDYKSKSDGRCGKCLLVDRPIEGKNSGTESRTNSNTEKEAA